MYESQLLSHPLLTTSRSKETAAYRCNEGGTGYRERVSRRFPSPEVVPGRHQRGHQTLRRAVLLDTISTITEGFTPGIKGRRRQARGP